jgi:hypothetical protein
VHLPIFRVDRDRIPIPQRMEAVMFTMALDRGRQSGKQARMPMKALRLAALLGALVLIGLAVNALTIYAHGSLRVQSSLHDGDCSLPAYKATRPACHDLLPSEPAYHPFRGATAPALDHSL